MCSFCTPHSIAVIYPFNGEVLHGNVAFSIIVLSSKKHYSSFLRILKGKQHCHRKLKYPQKVWTRKFSKFMYKNQRFFEAQTYSGPNKACFAKIVNGFSHSLFSQNAPSWMFGRVLNMPP